MEGTGVDLRLEGRGAPRKSLDPEDEAPLPQTFGSHGLEGTQQDRKQGVFLATPWPLPLGRDGPELASPSRWGPPHKGLRAKTGGGALRIPLEGSFLSFLSKNMFPVQLQK